MAKLKFYTLICSNVFMQALAKMSFYEYFPFLRDVNVCTYFFVCGLTMSQPETQIISLTK